MPTVHRPGTVARGAHGWQRPTSAATAGVLAVTVASLLAAGCGPPPEVDSEDDPRGAPDALSTGTTAGSSGPSPTMPGSPPTSGSAPGAWPSGAASPPGRAPSGPTDPGLPGDSPSPPEDEPGFPEEIALACDDHLPAEELLALLQRQRVLPNDHDAEVTNGPYCSGEWHYSQVAVPGRDPLQTVSRGDPEQLTLVTAGTDVCTVEVRMRAPAGIRRTAACLD